MSTEPLHPRYDSRSSFYGKAEIRFSANGDEELLSYGTHVATITSREGGKAYIFGTYSATTLRHIKEFLKQSGFQADTAKQIMADYGSDYSDVKTAETGRDEATNGLKTVGMVMAIGGIMAETPKEANDWKLRMLKAGVPEGALHMPDDWDDLPEAEKAIRLDKIIKMFTDNKEG